MEQRLSEETGQFMADPVAKADTKRLNKLLIQDAFRVEVRNPQGRRWSCCWYLAGKLEECIAKVVDPEAKLKDWLRSVASAQAGKNKGVSWISPSGFPVSQEAVVMTKHSPAGMTIRKRTTKIHKAKQQRKIVANFIHSLDAAHLMRTIDTLRAQGLGDFGVIHDGYSVHACHVEVLQRVLREEFVEMYSKPVLEEFLKQQRVQDSAPQSTKDCPKFATLLETMSFNILDVKRSLYFFC